MKVAVNLAEGSEKKGLSGTLQSQQTLNGSLTSKQGLEGSLSNEVLRGYSAYQVAVLNGFEGTEKEWLNSLKGDAVLVDSLVSDDGNGNITYEVSLHEEIVSDDGNGNLTFNATLVEGGVPAGTTDYEKLKNKPSINGVELNGNVTLEQLGLIGNGLKYDKETNQLAVNMADDVEQDNTLPCSSSLVYQTVGNIQELLKTI